MREWHMTVEQHTEIERQLVKEVFEKNPVGLETRTYAAPFAMRSKSRKPSEAVPCRTHSTARPRSSHKRSAARRLRIVNAIADKPVKSRRCLSCRSPIRVGKVIELLAQVERCRALVFSQAVERQRRAVRLQAVGRLQLRRNVGAQSFAHGTDHAGESVAGGFIETHSELIDLNVLSGAQVCGQASAQGLEPFIQLGF